jgi:hypothetical protein
MRISRMPTTDAPTDQARLPAADKLPDHPALLRRIVLELLATLQTRGLELASVRQRLGLWLRRLNGPRGQARRGPTTKNRESNYDY